MHVNNEIGVIQTSRPLGELTVREKILLHVDAAQGAGKAPIDMETMKIDLMSLSAQDLWSKGIGALYVRRKPKGQGWKRRSTAVVTNAVCVPGTLATHQIVGMGEAFVSHGKRWLKTTTHSRTAPATGCGRACATWKRFT